VLWIGPGRRLAHNGLVGGSNPPGPATAIVTRARRRPSTVGTLSRLHEANAVVATAIHPLMNPSQLLELRTKLATPALHPRAGSLLPCASLRARSTYIKKRAEDGRRLGPTFNKTSAVKRGRRGDHCERDQMKEWRSIFLRSIFIGPLLLTWPAGAQEHRFEDDPIVAVRE
jgi:hypothetical protein